MRSKLILGAVLALAVGCALWFLWPRPFDKAAWLATQPVQGVQTDKQNTAFCALREPAARAVASRNMAATLALLGPPARSYRSQGDHPPHEKAGDHCIEYSGTPCELMSTSVSALSIRFAPTGQMRLAYFRN